MREKLVDDRSKIISINLYDISRMLSDFGTPTMEVRSSRARMRIETSGSSRLWSTSS